MTFICHFATVTVMSWMLMTCQLSNMQKPYRIKSYGNRELPQENVMAKEMNTGHTPQLVHNESNKTMLRIYFYPATGMP